MKKRNPAFTVELLGLFILLVLVITVITQVFVMSRAHSLQAKRLTDAVILAEDMAEVCSTEKETEELGGKLSELYEGTTVYCRRSEDGSGKIWFMALFAEKPDIRMYYVVIDRSTDRDVSQGNGVYVKDVISIYDYDDTVSFAEMVAQDYSGKSDSDSAGQDETDSSDDNSILRDGAISDRDEDDRILRDGAEPVYTLTTGTYFGVTDDSGEIGEHSGSRGEESQATDARSDDANTNFGENTTN